MVITVPTISFFCTAPKYRLSCTAPKYRLSVPFCLASASLFDKLLCFSDPIITVK